MFRSFSLFTCWVLAFHTVIARLHAYFWYCRWALDAAVPTPLRGLAQACYAFFPGTYAMPSKRLSISRFRQVAHKNCFRFILFHRLYYEMSFVSIFTIDDDMLDIYDFYYYLSSLLYDFLYQHAGCHFVLNIYFAMMISMMLPLWVDETLPPKCHGLLPRIYGLTPLIMQAGIYRLSLFRMLLLYEPLAATSLNLPLFVFLTILDASTV